MKFAEYLVIAPKTGTHQAHTLMGTDKNPMRIEGLTTELVEVEGKYRAHRVKGTVERTHYDGTFYPEELFTVPDSGLGRIKYEPGDYDLLLVQDAPQDWSGWF